MLLLALLGFVISIQVKSVAMDQKEIKSKKQEQIASYEGTDYAAGKRIGRKQSTACAANGQVYCTNKRSFTKIIRNFTNSIKCTNQVLTNLNFTRV